MNCQVLLLWLAQRWMVGSCDCCYLGVMILVTLFAVDFAIAAGASSQPA